MDKSLKCLIVFWLFLFCINAFAQKEIPELWGQRVHDEAHALTQATVDQLETQLKAYEDSTSNQIAILIISSLDGESLEDYSLRVAEKWKLGQKEKDNGVLLLIAIDDHKMRIEVGQGLEGVLTDAICNRIIRNEMAPDFRRDDYDAGVITAIDHIVKSIGGEYSGEDVVSSEIGLSIKERIFVGLFLFIVLGIFTTLALFSDGMMGWGLYAFLVPFYAVFPWVSLGLMGGVILFGCYLIGFPIFKLLLNRSPKWKSAMVKWQSKSGGGGRWSSGSGSSGSSWGGGSSSGFSGGGGSFGGGGSSGSW